MLKIFYEKYIKPKYRILLIAFILLSIPILFLLIYTYSKSDYKVEKKIVKDVITKEEKKAEEKPITYYVDIKGAVKNPGVYQMQEGSRVIDVINNANGLTENADTSVINLSKKVFDEMTIKIYTKNEINLFKWKSTSTEQTIKYIEKECTCPDPTTNDACISTETNTEETTNNTTTTISINTATKEQLMTLPSIGESKALAIIAYREKNGLFQSIEDIKNVTGIGDSIFDKIKESITL